MMQDSTTVSTSDREIVASRLLDAPRELVWQAWTDPAHLIHWLGPDGFTNAFHEFDLREGGVWRFVMHGPDGTDYPNKVIFREIVEPERLVYSHSGGDDGPDDLRFEVTVTFAERDGKTELTMRSVFESGETLRKVVEEYGAIDGARQTLARLETHVATMAPGARR